MGAQRFCLKSQLFSYFVYKLKSTYPVAVLCSLLFAGSTDRSGGISAGRRSVVFHC